MIRCADGSLYTGVTTEVARRFEEHSSGGPKAAKYLRGRGPFVLVYSRAIGSRSKALLEERRIKRLKKTDKEALLMNE
jgi:putative endonuclease